MKRAFVVFVAVVLSLLVVVPWADADPPGARTTGTARVRIRIVDNRFRPRSTTIDRGSVLTWRNRGSRTHTTTSDDGLWDSGPLSPGDTFRKRFRRRGTFTYHCMIHATMTGTITVT